MRLLIGADLVPTESNYKQFSTGQMGKLMDDKLGLILEQADFRIFNLETPLTDVRSPIKKCGPNLIAPEIMINGMNELNVDFFTLANNHILDQGEQGLLSTIKALDKAGIKYAGAGRSLFKAERPYICKYENLKIGIYCCAEHEFSIAGENHGGANPFDPLVSLDHIFDLKSKVDYVIVLYHGGKEHYRYPSPYLQRVCRRMVDKGANLVVCQHSHCIGCEEKYGDGNIVYGQGNFLFDGSDSKYWKTAFLIELNVSPKANVSIIYHPIIKNGNAVRLANENERKDIFKEFWKRSDEIKSDKIVQEKYDEFATEMLPVYLRALQGKHISSLWFRVLGKFLGKKFVDKSIRRNYREKEFLKLWNYFVCEAHNELIRHGMQNETKQSK
ncbi:MAG TPA: poly-gamma-glutamate biosynthesis protein [Lachnospiraceae bacterium]|jgi:poly-gamma-glutamate synthesis protein (capsule biosynthesis protein)|nr:poly-gamma-glutamate biosynthesis protein [Lachnospiraceae bacterium]